MYRYSAFFVTILCYNGNPLFRNTNALLKTAQIFVRVTLHDETGRHVNAKRLSASGTHLIQESPFENAKKRVATI